MISYDDYLSETKNQPQLLSFSGRKKSRPIKKKRFDNLRDSLVKHTENKTYSSKEELEKDLESYSSTFVLEYILFEFLIRWLISKLAQIIWDRITSDSSHFVCDEFI